MTAHRTSARNPPPADDAGATVAVPVDALSAAQRLLEQLLAQQATANIELAAIKPTLETRSPTVGLLTLGADELLVGEAAALAGVDRETIRNRARGAQETRLDAIGVFCTDGRCVGETNMIATTRSVRRVVDSRMVMLRHLPSRSRNRMAVNASIWFISSPLPLS